MESLYNNNKNRMGGINMNFNSQICTTREQSERLLALGLKKETADMTIHIKNDDGWYVTAEPFYEWEDDMNTFPSLEEPEPILSAWSLGRLLEMLPSTIPISEDLPTFHHYAYLDLSKVSAHYYWEDYDGNERVLVSFCGKGFFAAVVDAIEWLIKEGHFNKEYLV